MYFPSIKRTKNNMNLETKIKRNKTKMLRLGGGGQTPFAIPLYSKYCLGCDHCMKRYFMKAALIDNRNKLPIT